MKLKKFVSGLTSLTLGFSLFTGFFRSESVNKLEAAAADTVWNFDFGDRGTEYGYTGVSAFDNYSSARGYGFASTANMSNVSASGYGALSDAVQFKSTDEYNTFNVDLPNGLYQVSVTLGDTNRTSIKAEGMLQIINMTGNNAVDTFQIPITDGQLNIMATEGKPGYPYTMSSLRIDRISDNPEMKPTIWICGDSTVCNYYPLDTSVQGGWGQMLNQFIDTDKYEVRNLAASGQFAKGFVDAGQFKPVEYYGKKGDYYIISIGINDTNYSNADEYYQTVTSMVKSAKTKGMEVILVKQQGRNGDASRNPLLTGRWFGGQLDQIGSEQNVQVVDLFNLWQNHCISIGTDATTSLYMNGDTLHPNRQGAIKLAELFASQVDFSNVEYKGAAEMDESITYTFKNKNSGLYMTVADASATSGANVHQWGANKALANNTWKLKAASNGYYYVYSMLGDSNTYVLDVTAKKPDNGTNMEIYTFNGGDAQLFKFIKHDDGSYTVLTKVSGDSSCIEVVSAEKDSGSNIQQWECNDHDCQKWFIEKVNYQPDALTSTTTTTATTIVPATNVVKGDANCNGTVEIADAVYILQSISDPSSFVLSSDARLNADVLGNNGVDAEDALHIQKAMADIVEIDPYLPPVTTTATTTTQNFISRYYAIDASYNNGITETVNAGYSGESYVNLENSYDSSITWAVDVPVSGNYLFSFRIANGTDADRMMKVEVNEASDYWVQSFKGTGAWTSWAERGIVLPLNSGVNKIKLTSMTENGGPNFDCLTIEKTDEPIAEIYIPDQNPDDSTRENPVIYIAGDSTVQSYRESYAPQQGWGYYLWEYFNSNVSVSNHAIAGRSSKSFYDNGRLDTILDAMKKGDYLLIQFAINDADYTKTERYAPVCGNVNNPTEGSYEYYLSKYIEGTLAKGGTPILVTTVIGMKAYSNGKFVNSYNDHCNAMKGLAAKYNIPCVDLNTIMVNHYNSVGYDTAKSYHLMGAVANSSDGTHFCEKGANIVAGLVAKAIKELNMSLSQHIK